MRTANTGATFEKMGASREGRESERVEPQKRNERAIELLDSIFEKRYNFFTIIWSGLPEKNIGSSDVFFREI